jgi:selenocysteine lyase/cysteine desulfurase
MVDSAQSAGVLPIDVKEDHIDILAFTGHKGLFGPQGNGRHLY